MSATRKPSRLDGLDLTDRELQILALVATGLVNPAIGSRMHLATDTVKTHLQRIYRKLGARDRAHAVHIAHQKGILP